MAGVDHAGTDGPLAHGATGFAPVVGTRFTYQTTPAGPWDGVIHCQVLEALPNARLAYSWKGGDDANVGYGSKLDTVVAWTLTRLQGGTRLRVVHSGFRVPTNESAFRSMSGGWSKVVQKIGTLAAMDRHAGADQ